MDEVLARGFNGLEANQLDGARLVARVFQVLRGRGAINLEKGGLVKVRKNKKQS